MQDTLIGAVNGLDGFDGAYPRAWLLTVMRNANINRHRRQRPGLLHDATDLAGEADRRNPPAPSAEDVAAAHTPAPWIADALGRLSTRFRPEFQELLDAGLTDCIDSLGQGWKPSFSLRSVLPLDTLATTNDGHPKRRVVVRPPGATSGLLLARADGDHQRAAIGEQYAGRVGLFLRVEDFDSAHRRMCAHGVEFVSEPRDEPYGRVAVFVDVVGNRWDLLGPRP